MIEFLDKNAVTVLIVLCIIIAAELFVKIFVSARRVRGGHRASFDKHPSEVADELLDSSLSLGILIDAKEKVPVYVTDNAEKLTGISRESYLTDPHIIETLFSREDARKLRNTVEGWDGKEPVEADAAYSLSGDDKMRWGHLYITRTADEKYILIAFEDRTGVHDRETVLLRKLDEAQTVDESKTIFLSKMSHEIRTPMNGMLGMISLAKLSAADGNSAQAEEYLGRAENLSQFLLSIINDILDMTRIESGKLELETAPFSIGGMVEKIRSMFETTITEKGIEFVIETDDFSDITVLGDELRITQVISNLLSNSSKFTPAGGQITFTLRSMDCREGKLSLMMRVKDTGKGMNGEFLHRIFKPFEQEDAGIARRYGGSGLGMSISDSLVRLMGGQILVDSEEGKGTEFTVFIELALTEAEAEKQGESGVPEIDLNGRRLLMAEDNAINTMVALRLLSRRGLVVETALNGLECIRMFEEHEPGYYEAILMDIHMPELDGWEATKRIRAHKRSDGATIPIFALSADAFVEDRRHSAAVGMNGHISKPIDYAELEAALKISLAKTGKEP